VKKLDNNNKYRAILEQRVGEAFAAAQSPDRIKQRFGLGREERRRKQTELLLTYVLEELDLDDERAATVAELYPVYHAGKTYTAGAVVKRVDEKGEAQLFRVQEAEGGTPGVGEPAAVFVKIGADTGAVLEKNSGAGAGKIQQEE